MWAELWLSGACWSWALLAQHKLIVRSIAFDYNVGDESWLGRPAADASPDINPDDIEPKGSPNA